MSVVADRDEPMTEMSGREAVWLVARREFVERGRDRSFLVSTAMILMLVLGVILVPRLVGADGPTSYDIGVVGETAELGDALASGAGAFDAEIELTTFDDVADAEAAVRAGDLDAVVLPGPEVVTDAALPATLDAILQTTWRSTAQVELLGEVGVDPDTATRVLSPPPLPVRTLDGADRRALMNVAFIGMMVLYGQLFGYGFWVAMGIVEEKSTRVVEVLLSAIRPTHLLAGKVLGIGALAFLQLLLIAGIGVGAVAVTGLVEVPAGTAGLVGQVLLWFLLGFAFYSCAFAMAGALVPRQEELQNAMTPLTVIVLLSFFSAFAALNDPGGTVARVASLFPTSAPLAMPVRVAAGSATTWEIVAAILITVAAGLALVPLAARVYRGAVLRTGTRVKVREALRAAR